MSDRRLVIVDGNALLYRAFFAIPDLSTAEGRPTNAVFGFVKAMGQIRDLRRPTHWVVIFDGGLPAERKELLADYKAQRPPMPAKLHDQKEPCERFLDLSRIAWLRIQGEEADDVMASLARREAASVEEVLLVTSDKDLLQLVGDRIRVAAPSGHDAPMGPDGVAAKLGVPPGKIVEWLALVGDSADNIPGVSGVGPKTAAKLLADFGSLNELWHRLPEIGSERVRKALESSRDLVERNVAMVTLREIPCDLTLDAMALREPDRPALAAFFREMEFRSLAASLEQADLFGA
jgi:DNA polymerase-1